MKKIRKGHWKDTFRIHVLNLERFLFASKGTVPISGEQAVYLAGMIARKLDRTYQSMIRDMLWDDPSAPDDLIRKHDAYIGQNAPIVTLSRINAEYLTLQIARTGDEKNHAYISLPARYYGIASYYSNQAGNRALAEIFRFLGNHLPLVLDILEGYFNYVEAFGDRSDAELAAEFWERFGSEINERNAKKEGWEKRGIDPSRKVHISRDEFNRMIDFTGMN